MLSVALSTAGMVLHNLHDLLCSIVASSATGMQCLLQDLDSQLPLCISVMLEPILMHTRSTGACSCHACRLKIYLAPSSTATIQCGRVGSRP